MCLWFTFYKTVSRQKYQRRLEKKQKKLPAALKTKLGSQSLNIYKLLRSDIYCRTVVLVLLDCKMILLSFLPTFGIL